MKKVILATLCLTALSSAGASEKVGAYLFGVQYQRDTNATDALRFGLGLPFAGVFAGGGAVALSGDAAFLRHTAPATELVQPYYGGGLGLGTVFATSGGTTAGGVSLYPHVLGGANFNVTSQLSLFAEGSVGLDAWIGTGSAVTFGYGVRLGVNYTIR